MNEQTYQEEFIGFNQELSSFIFRLVTNKQDTEDIVQDVYLKALSKLETFDAQKASLKTWVFTIALNMAKNQLERARRWGENDLTVCEKYHTKKPERLEGVMNIFHSTPDARFEMKEHLDYCFTCISKTLELTQQVCLLLKEIYGFKQHEIMEIAGLTEGKVKHGIVDARKNMKRIFNDRCALINKNGVCNQCTSLNGIFNPDQDAHAKAIALKLSSTRQHEKLLDIRMALVKETDPLNGSSNLHVHFAENVQEWVDLALSEN